MSLTDAVRVLFAAMFVVAVLAPRVLPRRPISRREWRSVMNQRQRDHRRRGDKQAANRARQIRRLEAKGAQSASPDPHTETP